MYGNARALACSGRRLRRPHGRVVTNHHLATKWRPHSHLRTAGRDMRGCVCSPDPTAPLRLSACSRKAARCSGGLWPSYLGRNSRVGGHRPPLQFEERFETVLLRARRSWTIDTPHALAEDCPPYLEIHRHSLLSVIRNSRLIGSSLTSACFFPDGHCTSTVSTVVMSPRPK